MDATASTARVSARRHRHLTASLSERDWTVLGRLHEHGFLTTDQLQRFVFTTHASSVTAARTTRRVLARLERDQLLDTLPRRQGGPWGGSTPAVWRLTTAGRRLLVRHRPNLRALTPSHHRLAHSLAVADVHLGILAVAATLAQPASVTVEPACWRSFTGLGGATRTLKPDLAAELTGSDQHGPYLDRWLVEVDLGTESIPTLVRKCGVYDAYYRSSEEQATTGSFPLVLWIFDQAERVDQLRTAVTRAGGLTGQMFRYTTTDHLAEALGGGPS